MFDSFRENMIFATTLPQNRKRNLDINWDYVDSDMYVKWSVLLDGATYQEWFDKVADEIEGVLEGA